MDKKPEVNLKLQLQNLVFETSNKGYGCLWVEGMFIKSKEIVLLWGQWISLKRRYALYAYLVPVHVICTATNVCVNQPISSIAFDKRCYERSKNAIVNMNVWIIVEIFLICDQLEFIRSAAETY